MEDSTTNICFICTSLFPKLHKLDDCSETDNSKCYIVLLKYLLNFGLLEDTNEGSSEQLVLSSYIFKQLQDAGDQSYVESGGIQFCSRCTQHSKDVWSLRRDLEAIQIRIYDKLKLIHQTVKLGSKFLKKSESELPSTSTFENHFNEMLLRFQNYVSNSAKWLTRLEPDLWTNEVLTVADILKEEPTDSVINEMEVDDFFDFDLIPDADLSEPVEVDSTVTKPKRKPGRPKKKRGRPKKSLTPSSFYPLDVSEHDDNVHNSGLTLADPLQMESPKPIKRGTGRGRPKRIIVPVLSPPLNEDQCILTVSPDTVDVSEHADNVQNSGLILSYPEPIKPIKRGRPKRVIVPNPPSSEDPCPFNDQVTTDLNSDLTVDNKDKVTSPAQTELISQPAQKGCSKIIIESSTPVKKRKGKGGRRWYPKKTRKKKYNGPYINKSDFIECEPCQFKTHSYSTMEAHLRVQHETPTKSFNCLDCSLGFTTEKLYTLHLYYHKHAVKCEICSERVVVLEMKRHLEEIHQKKVFSCPGCSFVFLDFISLIHHTAASRHTSLLLPCMLCPEGTSQDPEICKSRQKLYTHLYHVHNMKDILLKCDEPNCTRTFFEMKKKDMHMLKHSIKIKCPDCDSVYSTKYGLDNHIRRVHKKETNFHCYTCSEPFFDKNQLNRHQIAVHGAPKTQCEICGKELTTKEYLSSHQRKMHGIGLDKHIEKNLECPICAKSCADNAILKRHMYVHSDVKDFACEICGFLTKLQSMLNRHMKIHAEIKQHACPHCPKRFAKSDNLKQHIRVHTGERPYQCDVCGSAFNQRTSMMIHKRKHRPDGSFVSRGPRNNKSKEETQTQPIIDQTKDNIQIPAQSAAIDIPSDMQNNAC